ncbi:hypothetical protein FRC09_019984 [Ceratobasidium sp. 395]|nr:hypothetical protein FRC09_019984 [Ceratobasidium sp. 395]
MPLQQATGVTHRFRKRIREIKLQPNTSAYDIGIEIYVDGAKIHKLPTLKKGQALNWTDLCLPCDVYTNSTIMIQVTEVHSMRKQVDQAPYQISQATDQGVVSLECNALQANIQIAFLSEEETEQAYSEAFVKSQQLEKRPGIVQRAGKVGDAFKVLLTLGSAMAELDPTGGAKVAFSLCMKAWESLERQEKQDTKLDELVENIAGMIPSVESIKGVADDDLSQTVVAMLNLIEDVSVFILSFRSRRAWRAMVSSESGEQIEAYTAKFRGLREQFDTRVNVQALRADELEKINKKLKPVGQASYNPDQQCLVDTRIDVINELSTWAQKLDPDSRLAWVRGPAGFGKSSIATSVCMRLDGDGTLGASFFCKRDSPELRDPRRVLTTIAYQLAMRWEPYQNAVSAALKKEPEPHTQHFQALYDALLGKPLQRLSKHNRGTLVIVVDALDECGDTDTRRQLLRCLQELSQLVPFLRVVVTSRPNLDIKEFFTQDRTSQWFMELNILTHDASNDIRLLVQDRLGNMIHIKDWPNDAVDQVSHRANGLFIWARTACKFIAAGYDKRKRLDLVLSGSGLADIDSLYTTAISASMPGAEGDNKAYMLQFLGAVIATATRTPLSVTDLALLLRSRVSQDVLEPVLASLLSVLYVDHDRDDAVRVSHPSFMDYITDRTRSNNWYIDLDEHNTILAECCLEIMAESLKFNICGLETSDVFNSDVQDLDIRVGAAVRPHLSYSCMYWSSHIVKSQIAGLDYCLRKFLFGRVLLYWIEALSLLGKLGSAPANLLELMTCLLPDSMQDCRVAANDAYRFVLSFYEAISKSTPHLYISALAFAPCDSGIALRMRNCSPRLLVVTEGAEKEWTPCLRSISVSGRVLSTTYSPDGRRIVSGSNDMTVRIWDAETGDQLLDPLTGHSDSVSSVAFSSDGRWIASGSLDKTIRLWDGETRKARDNPLRGHTHAVHSVAFSPNGSRLVSGSEDLTARVWDVEADQSMLELCGHLDTVWFVAFSPDGNRIISGTMHEALLIWDSQTGEQALEPIDLDEVHSVAFSPDGRRIAVGSVEVVYLLDAETGDILHLMDGHSDWVESVAFSPDSRLIASGSYDRTVRIWDAQTGVEVGQPLSGHSGDVHSVAFSPDGRRVVSGSSDETMRVWDIVSANIIAAAGGSALNNGLLGYTNSVIATFTSCGRRIVSSCGDNVSIWDAETGLLLGLLGDPEAGPDQLTMALSSNDHHLVLGPFEGDEIEVWDLEAGDAVLEPLQGHSDRVTSLTFSPDCRLIASGSGDKTIRIWDAETGLAVLQPLEGHSESVTSVSFSADSRRIVSGSEDCTVRIWDAETGQPVVEPLTGHSDQVTSVSFSPNDRIVSGSWDETVRIWNAETGNPVHSPLRGHTNFVQSVAFSPGGRWIASGSHDCTVRIWDSETGSAVLEPLLGHSGLVSSVAFSPDGRRIVTGGGDQTVRIWHIEPPTISSNETLRFLPGTRVQLLPQDAAGDKMLVNSAQLARHMHPKLAGWVISTEGKPVVWLPPELREIDDSTICISATRTRRPIIIDLTNFVHGTSWTSVLDPPV